MSDTNDDPRQIDDFKYPFGGSEEEQLAFILQYAPLAPSHRNSQPWQFRLADDQIGIFADPENTRHCSDPKDRQKLIGCGAAINTLEIVAAYFGHTSNVEYCVDDDMHRLASFRLKSACHITKKVTRLFHAVRTRQTNRSDFSSYSLAENLQKLCRLKASDYEIAANFVAVQNKRDEVARLVGFAVRELYADPWYRREFVQSLRANMGAPKDGFFNYEHLPLNLPSPVINPIVRSVDMSQKVADFFDEKIRLRSPTLMLLSAKDDNAESWLNTGRALNKLLVFLASEGITASYINYPIEFERLRNQLAGVFDVEGVPQILMRIGKASEVTYTGRYTAAERFL